MARPPADPVKKVRKSLESCLFGNIELADLNKKKKDNHEEHLRKYRLNVPIVGEIVPEVDSALDLACERLGIPREIVHGFITPDPKINGGMIDTLNNGNAVLTITAGAVEKLSYDELLYLIGHELGHFIFPHENIVTDADGDIASLEDAYLSRRMEILMDRIGLLTCRSTTFATSATLKVASGLGSQHIMANIPAYAEEALKGFKLAPTPRDIFASHPALFIRIRSLMLFSKSDAYAAYMGGEGGRPIAEVNKEVEVDLMNSTDHMAFKHMAECISELPVHLHVASRLHGLQVPAETFQVDQYTPDAEESEKAFKAISKIPKEKHEEALQGALFKLASRAIVRCPRRMLGVAREYDKRFENTPVHAYSQFFLAAWNQCKEKHLNERAFGY